MGVGVTNKRVLGSSVGNSRRSTKVGTVMVVDKSIGTPKRSTRLSRYRTVTRYSRDDYTRDDKRGSESGRKWGWGGARPGTTRKVVVISSDREEGNGGYTDDGSWTGP